jgi:hypothetical protein
MAMNNRRSSPGSAEPLLNSVARKLGHAAGTLAKVTQDVTQNIASIPEVLSAKERELGPASPGRPRARRASRRPKKQIGRSGRSRGTVTARAAGKRKMQKKSAGRRSR